MAALPLKNHESHSDSKATLHVSESAVLMGKLWPGPRYLKPLHRLPTDQKSRENHDEPTRKQLVEGIGEAFRGLNLIKFGNENQMFNGFGLPLPLSTKKWNNTNPNERELKALLSETGEQGHDCFADLTSIPPE